MTKISISSIYSGGATNKPPAPNNQSDENRPKSVSYIKKKFFLTFRRLGNTSDHDHVSFELNAIIRFTKIQDGRVRPITALTDQNKDAVIFTIFNLQAQDDISLNNSSTKNSREKPLIPRYRAIQRQSISLGFNVQDLIASDKKKMGKF